jgi:sugar/nucleoside kinase (ribokinase family)
VDPQTGGRTIFYMAKRYHLLKAADIPLDVVRRAKLVLVDGYERDAAPTVLEAVREVGGRRLWGRFPWSVWRRAFRRTAVAQPDGTGSLGRRAGCARARRAESPAHS